MVTREQDANRGGIERFLDGAGSFQGRERRKSEKFFAVCLSIFHFLLYLCMLQKKRCPEQAERVGERRLPLDFKRNCFMKKVLLFLIVAACCLSCGEYQQLLKSTDYQLIYRKAVEYYNNGDYQKAQNLLDGIRTVFSGTNKAQNIAYYRAFCSYNMKDYETASGLFKQFVQTYPESSFAEECLFMMGYCDYMASPKPRLDQSLTDRALSEFQLYLNRYPNSMRKERINEYMDELRDKLSYKAYLSARNYYQREYYKAATVSLQNCLKDYPGSKYREEIMYMLFMSKYEMAVNSVEDKKLERYNNAQEEYYYFAEEYPESKYADELKKCYEVIEAYLDNYNYEEE